MPLPDTIRRIVLTGFMGSGKSTVGALLAEAVGWHFLDSDTVIEEQAGMSIAEIFAQQGEPGFRALETAAIEECARKERLILALGGGALESASTRRLLAEMEETCIVFLDAPLEVMVARCLAQPGAAERPVLASREHLPARLAARLPWYREAHLTVSTEEFTPDRVVRQILNQMGGRYVIGETTAASGVAPARRKGGAGR